jgi:hypothetical protein
MRPIYTRRLRSPQMSGKAVLIPLCALHAGAQRSEDEDR